MLVLSICLFIYLPYIMLTCASLHIQVYLERLHRPQRLCIPQGDRAAGVPPNANSTGKSLMTGLDHVIAKPEIAAVRM